MFFKPDDIKYIKNVKRNDGTEWAYFDAGMAKTFNLNFSDDQIKEARNVKPGEIIVLFQNVDQIEGVDPQTYLTHLVTPIGYGIKKDTKLPHHYQWKMKVLVIGRATPRHSIFTVPSELNFRGLAFGKLIKVEKLNKTKTLFEVQNEIWELFRGHIKPDIQLIVEKLYENEGPEFIEGLEIEVKKHLKKERNRMVVELAKRRALERFGKLICQCCSINFRLMYGSHSGDFIEGHHVIPIGTGGVRKTKLEDIALVCSNCHRMLHKKISGTDKYPSVDDLRTILRQIGNLHRFDAANW